MKKKENGIMPEIVEGKRENPMNRGRYAAAPVVIRYDSVGIR